MNAKRLVSELTYTASEMDNIAKRNKACADLEETRGMTRNANYKRGFAEGLMFAANEFRKLAPTPASKARDEK